MTNRPRRQADLLVSNDDVSLASNFSLLVELSASMAHEISQPLTAIRIASATGLRLMDRHEIDRDLMRELWQRVAAQTARTQELVDEVPQMVAKRSSRMSRTALGALVTDAIQFVRHELERNGVVLSISLAAEPDHIHADRVQVQQVFVNLLLNAIQIMEEAGVKEPRVSVESRRMGDLIRIEVADVGPGVAVEDLDRIFEGFYTTRVDGMGLGLRICRKVMQAHKGSIVAGNRLEGGAIFTLDFPALPPAWHEMAGS